MSPTLASGQDDQQLVRYLLGLLDEEEADRLDELSVTDDEVAWRVRAVENELVDAYVRGGLEGDTLRQFESHYLASPRRREKVRFARSFLQRAEALPVDTEPACDAVPGPVTRPDVPPSRGPLWYEWFVPRSAPAWGLMAAAALLLAAFGALLVRDARLRQDLTTAQQSSAALDRRARELEQQLNDQRLATADAAKALDRTRASATDLAQRPSADRSSTDRPSTNRPPGQETPAPTAPATSSFTAVALVLLPQTRSAGPIPTLVLQPAAHDVALDLRLESSDFSRYQAALNDPVTSRILWRSLWLAARGDGQTSSISVAIPASVLKPQHYTLDVSGRGATGAPEIVGSYAFQIGQR
jgi:hypothetical protein